MQPFFFKFVGLARGDDEEQLLWRNHGEIRIGFFSSSLSLSPHKTFFFLFFSLGFLSIHGTSLSLFSLLNSRPNTSNKTKLHIYVFYCSIIKRSLKKISLYHLKLSLIILGPKNKSFYILLVHLAYSNPLIFPTNPWMTRGISIAITF